MNESKRKIICVAAGKSGGHLIPALQLAERQLDPDASLVLLSTGTALDRAIAQQYPRIWKIVNFHFITFHKKRLWSYPVLMAQTIAAFLRCLLTFLRARPQKVITTGGFIALPSCLAAKVLRIPVELYELNVEPGKATRLLSYLVNSIGIVFTQTQQFFRSRFLDRSSKCRLVSYPVRFLPAVLQRSRTGIIEQLNAQRDHLPAFSATRKTLFLLGGSQGSQFLNQALKGILEQYPELAASLQIIHQTGSDGQQDWQAFYAQRSIPAITFAFNQQIQDYYLLADAVLCRAGAGTLFELLFFKKQTIVVPLTTRTTAHQILNAQAMATEYPHYFTMLDQQLLQQSPSPLLHALKERLALVS